MIQQVTYNNGNKVLVGLAEKAGSSTAIVIMGYPLLGEFKYRKDRADLFRKKIWVEKNYISVDNWLDFDARIAIVRDPVKRFVSCYKDRIYNKNKDGTREYVKSFDDFLNNFDLIKKKSKDIRKHSLPLVEILGPSSNYNKIICLEELNNKFIPLIQNISDTKKIPVSYHKTSRKAKEVILSSRQIEKIQSLYKDDYNEYGKWFI